MTYSKFSRKTYYSLELKHKICKEHLEDGIRMADLVRKYHLSNHSLIHDWLRQLGYITGSNRRTLSSYICIENLLALQKQTDNKYPQTAEQAEIELLKKQLEEARLQVEGYRRMIELAEAELKVSIRKKPNTK
jgi:transposase-like protein